VRIGGLALLAAALAGAPPAAAQVTCRPNVLGAEVCVGVPAPSTRDRLPYAPRARGLGGVQTPVRPEPGPELVPARRADALGTTVLTASDLPPRRPPLPGVAPVRSCVRDALGHLTCR
jgi:hypothetical protein